MNRILGLLLLAIIALAGLRAIFLGLPSSTVIAEQPAKPDDVVMVNSVGEEGQITDNLHHLVIKLAIGDEKKS